MSVMVGASRARAGAPAVWHHGSRATVFVTVVDVVVQLLLGRTMAEAVAENRILPDLVAHRRRLVMALLARLPAELDLVKARIEEYLHTGSAGIPVEVHAIMLVGALVMTGAGVRDPALVTSSLVSQVRDRGWLNSVKLVNAVLRRMSDELGLAARPRE